MDLRWIAYGFQIASALCAFGAAWLWWRSTKAAPPKRVTWMGIVGGGIGRPLGGVLGGGESVSVVSNGFDEMVDALNEQSQWNRWAAFAAIGAAIAQAVASLLSVPS